MGRPPTERAVPHYFLPTAQALKTMVKNGRPPLEGGGSPYPLWSAKQFERRIKFMERKKMGRPPKDRAAPHFFSIKAQRLKG